MQAGEAGEGRAFQAEGTACAKRVSSQYCPWMEQVQAPEILFCSFQLALSLAILSCGVRMS